MTRQISPIRNPQSAIRNPMRSRLSLLAWVGGLVLVTGCQSRPFQRSEPPSTGPAIPVYDAPIVQDYGPPLPPMPPAPANGSILTPPTPLPPQASAPNLAVPPPTRFVPQPQAQPLPYAPVR